MKKINGFTLIELLAVILILGIIALIAIPTVATVVKESKKGSFETSLKRVLKSAEEKCVMQQMRGEVVTTSYIFSDGNVNPTLEINGTLPKSGSITIGDECKATVNANDDDFCAVKPSNDSEVYIGEIKDGECIFDDKDASKYESYSIGDEVTLSDGTSWIVIKDSSSVESEVKIMSQLNFDPDVTTVDRGLMMFKSAGYEIAYDDNSNIWNNSTLKNFMDTTVKSRLEDSLNIEIDDVTIWGVEELKTLGCEVSGDATKGYTGVDCYTNNNEKTWYSKVFEVYSWTKLPYALYDNYAWTILYGGSPISGFGEAIDVTYTFATEKVSDNSVSGVRPVITISKDVIN